ncbi:MAG: hypothetical protein V4621_02190 [Pseudomonadota bacterium]
MDPRTEYMTLILEKLGTPLLAAVHEVGSRAAATGIPAPSPREDAEKVAALLGLTTQAALSLSDKMDLKADENSADGLRVAVTALVSPLIAGTYQISGRIPQESDIDRMIAGFETVLAYADTFSDAADIRNRVQDLDREWAPADAMQVGLQYFQILVPVVGAVQSFSFGLPEKKMLNDVTAMLLRDARSLRDRLTPDANGTIATKAELALLRACALLYSQCHYGEMARLMGLGDKARDMPMSADPVMKTYELRLALLAELAQTLIFGGSQTESATAQGGPAPTAAQAQAPADNGVPSIFMAPPPASNDSPAQAEQVAPSGDPGDPMSFFAKKEG